MKARVRIAIAQIATLPAYASPNVDYLREPLPPLKSILGPRGFLARLRNASGVGAFTAELSLAHEDDLREKLRAVGQFLSPFRPHLIVLPEYSVPARLLANTRALARDTGAAVIAGTHAVLSTNIPLYQQCGMEELARIASISVRKAVCPVFFPDGSSDHRFKASPSKWEPDLVRHLDPQSSVQLRGDGFEYAGDIRICIDALSLPGPASGAQLLVITSWTPQTEPFISLFDQALLREIPGVLTNSALYGGSRVFTSSGSDDSRADFLSVSAAEEAILVVDIDLERQFETRGSAVSQFPAAAVARAPLLSSAVADHVEASEHLVALRNGAPVGAMVERISTLRIPSMLRQAVDWIASAAERGSCTQEDIAFASSHILVPSNVVPFWNRCAQGLDDTRRLITDLLQQEGHPEAAVTLLPEVEKARKHARQLAYAMAREPGTMLDNERERAAPFVNREEEQRRLRDLMRGHVVVALEGLPGIGKRTLALQVARELFPTARAQQLQAAPGMTVKAFLNQIGGLIGQSVEGLSAMSRDARRQVSGVVIVRDADLVFAQAAEAIDALKLLKAALDGTQVRLLLLCTRRGAVTDETASLSIMRLREDHFERVFEYWAQVEGVEADLDVARRLHGYPIAAKFAARLIREGRSKGLRSVGFIDTLRSEIVRELLRDLPLNDVEKKVIDALSVFRRPVDDALLQSINIPDLDSAVSSLESCFLIERAEGRLFVMPLVREVVQAEWAKTGAARALHEIAAKYHATRIKDPSVTRRFEHLDEAQYHYIALGDFKQARLLGNDWIGLATAAREDHWHRRAFKECAAICEAILSVKGENADALGRLVLCHAKMAKWQDAEKGLQRLNKLGPVPRHVTVGYAENLIAKGMVEQGRQLLEGVIQKYADDAYARAALAELYFEKGDMGRARDLVQEALEIEPDNLRGLDMGARVARRDEKWEEAYRCAMRAMNIAPRRSEQTFRKVVAAIRKAFNGKMPSYVSRTEP